MGKTTIELKGVKCSCGGGSRGVKGWTRWSNRIGKFLIVAVLAAFGYRYFMGF